MSNDGLSSPLDSLRDAARACFADLYSSPTFHVEKALKKLPWTPALRFVLHRHVHVFVEPSDSGPYPRRLHMLHTKVSNHPEPIAVYSVCHEAAMDNAARRELKSHGFGLVTVGQNRVAEVVFPAIPIVQVITEAEFKQRTGNLPKGIRQPVSEAFQDYVAKPVNGVKTLSEIVEGMVTKAGRDSAKKGCISNKDSGKALADVLDALYQKHPQARADIGRARGFIKECRNLSHHWPRNKKDAYNKYANCRHDFLNGLHTIQTFRKAMKDVGLTGNLART